MEDIHRAEAIIEREGDFDFNRDRVSDLLPDTVPHRMEKHGYATNDLKDLELLVSRKIHVTGIA